MLFAPGLAGTARGLARQPGVALGGVFTLALAIAGGLSAAILREP